MYGSASDEWEFLVSRDKVYEWAEAAHAHHLERFDFWLQAKDGYEIKLRNEGLTIESYQHSGGRGINAKIDTEIGDHLNTAMSRMRFHEHEIEFFKSVLVALDNEIERPSFDGPVPRAALKFKLADFRRFGCLGWELTSERE